MLSKKNHIINYFKEVKYISDQIDISKIEKLVKELVKIRKKKGRLFFLGIGGGAANSSHAVNDFRKICQIESYAPTDNVSELTARINDEGWETSLAEWLNISRLRSNDGIFIMSVGGGSIKKKVSINLVKAIDFAKKKKAKVFGIVGRDGGFTKKKGDVVIVIPTVNQKMVTPHSEAFQAVIWHCLVSHPLLQIKKMKW